MTYTLEDREPHSGSEDFSHVVVTNLPRSLRAGLRSKKGMILRVGCSEKSSTTHTNQSRVLWTSWLNRQLSFWQTERNRLRGLRSAIAFGDHDLHREEPPQQAYSLEDSPQDVYAPVVSLRIVVAKAALNPRLKQSVARSAERHSAVAEASVPCA